MYSDELSVDSTIYENSSLFEEGQLILFFVRQLT